MNRLRKSIFGEKSGIIFFASDSSHARNRAMASAAKLGIPVVMTDAAPMHSDIAKSVSSAGGVL